MFEVIDVTLLLTIIGVLVGLVNILTQVIKKFTWDKIPSSLLAFVVSQAVTIIAFFAFCSIRGIEVLWYYVVGAVVVGFMVAYAAMFGYDKLKEIIDGWFKLKGGK